MPPPNLCSIIKVLLKAVSCTNPTNPFGRVILSTYELPRSVIPDVQGPCQTTEAGKKHTVSQWKWFHMKAIADLLRLKLYSTVLLYLRAGWQCQ
jgi:hypothetical protein